MDRERKSVCERESEREREKKTQCKRKRAKIKTKYVKKNILMILQHTV